MQHSRKECVSQGFNLAKLTFKFTQRLNVQKFIAALIAKYIGNNPKVNQQVNGPTNGDLVEMLPSNKKK